jgi:hypothetical protein
VAKQCWSVFLYQDCTKENRPTTISVFLMLFLKGRQVEVVMEDNACFYDLTYYLYGCSNQSPDADEEERQIIPTLNLLNVSYEITEYIRPWVSPFKNSIKVLKLVIYFYNI